MYSFGDSQVMKLEYIKRLSWKFILDKEMVPYIIFVNNKGFEYLKLKLSRNYRA